MALPALTTSMQEEGFNATLPLLYNVIPRKQMRTLKSSSLTCAAMPFSAMELMDAGGINYSCNISTKNLILYDRLQTQNYNGFILGTPGSGKSFTAKVEMLNVLLGSNAKCIVIDPESEYSALAKLTGGEVIKIMPGGKWHINPMAITPEYEYNENEDEENDVPVNPVLGKAAFILRLLETIVKSPFGLNSIQETIVDECVHSLYEKEKKKAELLQRNKKYNACFRNPFDIRSSRAGGLGIRYPDRNRKCIDVNDGF